MEKVKLFNFYKEINPILEKNNIAEEDFFEYSMNDNIVNNSAIKWYVEDEKENEMVKILNSYFISNGCVPNEKILIWISW